MSRKQMRSVGKKKAVVTKRNRVEHIMAFEGGELDDDGTIALFQHLVDTGLAWQLQGSYGRAATRLIEAGLVEPKRRGGK